MDKYNYKLSQNNIRFQKSFLYLLKFQDFNISLYFEKQPFFTSVFS